MKIKYLGPSGSVNVVPYGSHVKGQTVDYPDSFAEELLSTSKKQRFKRIAEAAVKTNAKDKAKK